MSLFYIERRQTPSLYRAKSVSVVCRKERPRLYMGRDVSLLHTEEADSLFIETRESLLYIERRDRERESFSSKMRMSLLYAHRRLAFSLYTERVSLLYI